MPHTADPTPTIDAGLDSQAIPSLLTEMDAEHRQVLEGIAALAALPADRFASAYAALVAEISPEVLTSFAQDPEHLAALQAIAAQSLIAVPLLAGDTVLGVIALVSASAPYGPADLLIAEDLARRAALSIENARLYRAAREAIQSRDDVLAVVAHDLRNPLNAILLNIALLHEPGRDAMRVGATIDRAARRMDRLIQDLLDVARIESGRLTIERDCVSTAKLLADIVET